MSTARLRILLCGDYDSLEMRSVAACVARLAPHAEVRRVPDLKDLATVDDNESGWTPDLVVVAQSRPEQFPQSDVRRLQARFPLARCVCCCGAWCKSDGRNSSLWPDAVRVSARTSELRIRRELLVLEGRLSPLPLTASRDEIFAFDSPGDWEHAGNGITVLVKSNERELRTTIEDLLKSGGFEVVSAESERDPSAVVWDVDPWSEARAAEIQEFARTQPNVRVIAMMNFGHPDAAAKVLACGAHAVVAKLSPADQLFDALAHSANA